MASELPIDTRVEPRLFDGDTAAVNDAVALSKHIADSGKGHQCMVRQYFRHAHARREVASRDGCDLESLRTKLTGSAGSLREMFKEIARRDSFRQRKVQ